MRAVFSYWDRGQGYSAKTGYNNNVDFLRSITMAVNVAKKHFKEVVLVSNTNGAKALIDGAGLPFTSSIIAFDGLETKVSGYFWGYSKLIAYHVQDRPFVHIDNDVYLWDGILPDVIDKPIFFQSVEPYMEQPQYYGWYKPLLDLCQNKAPFFPEEIRNNPSPVSYNCGIMGANDLSIIDKWFELSSSYVLNKDNNRSFFRDKRNLMIHQNLLHEQYFIASILTAMKYSIINRKIGILCKDLNDLSGDFKYTHLWGLVKNDNSIMYRLDKKLREMFPQEYCKLTKYICDNGIQ